MCLVTFRSPTYAMKAQKILKENGVYADAVKLGSEYAANGCTQGLRFDCRNRRSIEKILSVNHVPYAKLIAE